MENEKLLIFTELKYLFNELMEHCDDVYNRKKRSGIIDEKIDGMSEAYQKAISMIEEAENKYLELSENDGWIFTKDRLPDEIERERNALGADPGSTFIAMIKGATLPIGLTLLDDDKWVDQRGIQYPVVAWREFPIYRKELIDNE